MGIHWFSRKKIDEPQTLGLILPGGGARNAYQVGVLKAVEELIVSKNYSDGMERLLGMWENLQMEMVVHTDSKTAAKAGARWLWSFASGGAGNSQPDSLLDNTPLRSLIENHINLARMRQHHLPTMRARMI